jgi:hypothetical protein
MRLLVAALSIAATGCFATVPAPFAEGTEVLKPHATGVALVAAGGGVGGICKAPATCAGQGGVGGELRIRLGLRGNQEIGVSGYGAFVASSNNTFIGGGEISYKIAPVPWLAFVAGAGGMDENDYAIFGGNLAAIIAPYTSEHGSQLYTGARGSFGIPLMKNATGATESVIVPVGFSFKSGGDVRVFLEGGLAVAFNQYHDELNSLASQESTFVGGYGAVGILLTVR